MSIFSSKSYQARGGHYTDGTTSKLLSVTRRSPSSYSTIVDLKTKAPFHLSALLCKNILPEGHVLMLPLPHITLRNNCLLLKISYQQLLFSTLNTFFNY